jgi:deoxyribose-phosphate aldolase
MNFDRNIASLIDHTILIPDATRLGVLQVCADALKYGFASVCVNSCWVPAVAAELAGSTVKTCTVVGFPLGASSTAAKVAETVEAVAQGATEIDMVINIGALKGGEEALAEVDIAAVVSASHAAGAIVKVIIETALLDHDQKVLACQLAKRAGADFVKTSTGFAASGATVDDVVLMRSAVGPLMGVKASGGIRNLETLKAMVEAGATRIGASSSVRIMEATAV